MKPQHIILAAIILTATTGCDDTKKALGFEKAVPNEFKVAAHPPLSLPPDYGLRPPRAGEESPNQIKASERASKALTGQPRSSDGKSVSAAESALLKNAGADNVPDNIRDIVKSEEKEANKEGLWDKIKEGTLITDKKEGGVALDPAKERERLKSDKPADKSDAEKPKAGEEPKESTTTDSEEKPSIKLEQSEIKFESITLDPEAMSSNKDGAADLPATLEESVEKSN